MNVSLTNLCVFVFTAYIFTAINNLLFRYKGATFQIFFSLSYNNHKKNRGIRLKSVNNRITVNSRSCKKYYYSIIHWISIVISTTIFNVNIDMCLINSSRELVHNISDTARRIYINLKFYVHIC